MSRVKTPEMDEFFRAILSLKTEEECYLFFSDLCTINELKSMSQWFQVALELDAGKNYNEVYERTGVSTATICRVKKCVEYGNGGYRLVLDRLAEEDIH